MKNKKPLIQVYNQDNKLLGQFDNMQRAMHIFKDLTNNQNYKLIVNGKALERPVTGEQYRF